MTDEQLRIKVAELCGWTQPPGTFNIWKHKDFFYGSPPDYPNDLNACASFEEILPADKQDEYCVSLWMQAQKEHASDMDVRWRLVHATAHQRCLAFVRTMEGGAK